MSNFILGIKTIHADIKDLTWAGELFKFEFFRRVHDEPDKYIETVLPSLSGGNMSEQQNIIMVLMMQKLPLAAYLDFAENVYQMLEKGEITHDVFKWAVFPGYEWNTSLAENYKANKVRALINKFMTSEKVDEKLKRYFREELLTGKAKEQVQFLRDIGQIK